MTEPRIINNLPVAQTEGREIVAAEKPGALLSAIVTMAKDPTVDVAKLQALLEMQERMEARAAETEFNGALHRAQAEVPHIKKNGTVSLGTGKGSYKFATWEDMDKVLRPIMGRHGFTLTFDMVTKEGGGAVITGKLLHVAGHARTASIPLALDSGAGRNNLQAMGSTMSYGRRYVAEMLFNIVRKGADDDGKFGGMELVTVEQADEIDRLLTATQSDRKRFMEHFEIAELGNMAADQFVVARNMLATKASAKAKA